MAIKDFFGGKSKESGEAGGSTSWQAASGPNGATSQMFTLEQLYQRLATGAAGTKMTKFTEPSAGPGSTMHTLDNIMAIAPAVDAADGAVPADVASGKTFWGLTNGAWGLQTGTASGGSTYPAPVPRTGQTACWASNGNSMACAGSGQDGEYRKGVAWPAQRFTVTNGTVTDNLTGLIWLKNANCPGVLRDWSTALGDVDQLNTNGTMNGNNCGDTSNGGSHQTDWRLPNARELQSLVDYGRQNPALPSGHPFTGVKLDYYYWSGTSFAVATGQAWALSAIDGVVISDLKDNTNYVWPVRGGQ